MEIKECFDYFQFGGERYPLNTVVKPKNNVYIQQHCIGALCNYPMVQIVDSFISKDDIHRWAYAIWYHSGHVGYYRTSKTPDEMLESIVEVPTISSANNEERYYKDFEVPAVRTGWVIYVLFLITTLIFTDFIVAWVFGTWYFFAWRKNKLKKPDLKYGFDVDQKVEEWNERKT